MAPDPRAPCCTCGGRTGIHSTVQGPHICISCRQEMFHFGAFLEAATRFRVAGIRREAAMATALVEIAEAYGD